MILMCVKATSLLVLGSVVNPASACPAASKRLIQFRTHKYSLFLSTLVRKIARLVVQKYKPC